MHMNYQDIVQKTDKEIQDLLNESRRHLHALAVAARIRQLKNVSEIKKTRRQIARMLTCVRSRLMNS